MGRIGAVQDNVITAQQLQAVGLGRGALARRLESGRMQRLHRGVYLIGPAPPSFAARCRAAALAVGRGAKVCHWSAAAVRGPVPARTAGDAPGIRSS